MRHFTFFMTVPCKKTQRQSLYDLKGPRFSSTHSVLRLPLGEGCRSSAMHNESNTEG